MISAKTTILIVEDERIIALDLKQQLEALGYNVCALVANGEVALQKAKELHPDLLLMEIHIEGPLDGIDTARRIYAELHLPVIFLTAYTEDATLERAIEILPYGYLVKPWNVRELHAAIQTALARHTAESALEQSEERLRLALDAAALGVWEWEAATDRFTIGGHL
ncbi:MAG: hypothetical protein FD130_2130, partial [Halothiobacillaceae bacterium]